MITGITIENFKGIRERIELPLRPVTLLFGPNSAGKSSIIHALHYAREIFARRNLDADSTVSGGKYVDLGGFRRFVHGGDASRAVSIGVAIGDPTTHLDIPDDASWLHVPEGVRFYLDEAGDLYLNGMIEGLHVDVSIAWSDRRQEAFVWRYAVRANGEQLAEIICEPDGKAVVLRQINFEHPLLPDRFPTLYDDGNDLFEELESISRQKLLPDGGFNEDLSVGFDQPRNRGGWLRVVAAINQALYPGDNIPLMRMRDALPEWDTVLPIKPLTPEHECLSRLQADEAEIAAQAYNAFIVYFTCLMVSSGREVSDKLKQFHYLGPLRETPAREFTPPRFADPSRWSSGLGAWDRLMNGPPELVESTSHWLGDEDRLASGYRIARRQFKEVALDDPLIVQLQLGRAFDDVEPGARLALDRLPTSTRLVITPTNVDLELQPHDVGIGISQVVPVIVTSLDGARRIVAIEQPELHLHPKLQAALGDLFIEAALGETKHMVMLETHSEHLILRLQRRVRETSKGSPHDGQPISADDIIIYYVNQDDGRTLVRQIELDDKGDFIQPWPDDFFEIDFHERFA